MLRFIFIALFAFVLTACKTTTTQDLYGKQTDKQIFTHAESEIARGNYDTAVKDLEALDTLYPFSDYSQQGQLDLIYAYYKSGDNVSALAAADRYMRLYPRSPSVDYALYMKGLANMGPEPSWVDRWTLADPAQRDFGNMEAAYQTFHVLIERFPNSQYVPEARKHMQYIRNLMAQHQLEVAQYYMKRKAYVAAVNRATTVVENYPNTQQVKPALQIMVDAYTQLNQPQLANSARQMLVERYPDTKTQ